METSSHDERDEEEEEEEEEDNDNDIMLQLVCTSCVCCLDGVHHTFVIE
jgi:hypothetical protein